MSIRRFDRTYYSIEKDGNQTLVFPHTRIAWCPAHGSLAIQKSARPGDAITIELWQRAEQSDIDCYQWGEPEPASIDRVLDELIINSTSTPWSIDGIEEQDWKGLHYDGQNARTFSNGEKVSLDDIRIAAYEEIDPDAPDRIDSYLLVEGECGRTIGMVLYPMDAEVLCATLDKEIGEGVATAEYMSVVGVRRPVDLSALRHAVLNRLPSSDGLLLVAATDTHEHARTIARCRRTGACESGLSEETIIVEVDGWEQSMEKTGWTPIVGWKGAGEYRGLGGKCPRCGSKEVSHGVRWSKGGRTNLPCQCLVCGLAFTATADAEAIDEGVYDPEAITAVEQGALA